MVYVPLCRLLPHKISLFTVLTFVGRSHVERLGLSGSQMSLRLAAVVLVTDVGQGNGRFSLLKRTAGPRLLLWNLYLGQHATLFPLFFPEVFTYGS